MAITQVSTSVLKDGAVTSAKLDTNIAIDGNLTVDTNTLYVDSTNNRVGIGIISPATNLHILSASSTPTVRIESTHPSGIPFLDLKGAASSQIRYIDETGTIQTRIDMSDNGGFSFVDVAGSASPRMVINSSGNVGIGTTSPNAKLKIEGAVSNNGLSIKSGGNGGTYPFMVTWASGTEGDAFCIDDNLNVGIGTTNPGYKLHVSGNSFIDATSASATLTLGRYSGQPTIKAGTDDSGYLIIDSSGGILGLNWYSSDNIAIAAGGGNVGIGGTNPSSKLEVISSVDSVAKFRSTAANSNINIGDASSTTSYSSVFFNTNSGLGQIWKAGTAYSSWGGVSALNIYNSNGPIAFHPNNTANAMFLSTSGNVGIGTTAPSSQLHVNGVTQTSGIISLSRGAVSTPAAAGWYRVGVWNTSSNRGGGVIKLSTTGGSFSPGTYVIKAYKNWSDVPTLKLEAYGSFGYINKARVQFDSTNSTYYLEVYKPVAYAVSFEIYFDGLLGYNPSLSAYTTGTLPNGTVGGTTYKELDFISLGTSFEKIYASGNVGIGTTSPAYKLDVVGDGIRNVRSTTGWAGWFENTNNSSGVVVTAGVDSGDAPLLIRKQDGTELFSVRGNGTSWFNNGNVGIGTSNPVRELEVQGGGNVYIRVAASTDNDSSAIELQNTQETWTIRNDDTNDDAFEIDSSTTGNIITIEKTGNVGIGTTSPSGKLHVNGDIRGTIFYDTDNTGYYLNPASTSNLNALTTQGQSDFRSKRHNFGLSTGWDALGFGNATNLHMNGHNQFWIGAGNGTWFTGTANSKSQVSGLAADASNAHDLLITTMQGTSTNDRGVTFGVDSSGTGTVGWRLGKWHSGDAKDSSKLVVDGGLFVKGGYTDEYDYYADDYSGYYSTQGGGAYWNGGTNNPSATFSTAIQIQSGNLSTNTRNPQIQFHQYGYGGVQFRYDGPADRMFLEPIGSNRLDWTRFQTDSGYIELGPANTGWAHIYTDRPAFYLNKGLTVLGGSQINSGDIRSAIFYDTDNTGYYVNPQSLSNIGSISLNEIISGSATSADARLGRNYAYPTLELKGFGSEMMIGAGTSTMHVNYRYCNNTASTSQTPQNWYWRAGTATSFSNHYWGIGYGVSSLRAPIFYDSDNTGYYVNPAGQSRMGSIERLSHSTGHLVGSYNSVGNNSAKTNPIYTIGSNYNPTDTSLASMYGIGYAHANLWGSGKTTGWGFYVAEAGVYNCTIGAGSTTIWAQNDIVAYSDKRVKDNIEIIPDAVEKVKQLNGVTFTRTDANEEDKNKRHTGVIAQDVLKVLPEAVVGSEEDLYSVAYGNMVGLLIEAIKEQQTQIDELKQLINKQ